VLVDADAGAKLDPAAGKLVEHGDLLGQPQRVVQG
jgi:hypothetical protein